MKRLLLAVALLSGCVHYVPPPVSLTGQRGQDEARMARDQNECREYVERLMRKGADTSWSDQAAGLAAGGGAVGLGVVVGVALARGAMGAAQAPPRVQRAEHYTNCLKWRGYTVAGAVPDPGPPPPMPMEAAR